MQQISTLFLVFSVAGEMEGVEKARARVRELTPLIFTFDLPIVSSVDINLDPNDPFLRAIQDQYNIQVRLIFYWNFFDTVDSCIIFRESQKEYRHKQSRIASYSPLALLHMTNLHGAHYHVFKGKQIYF